MVPRGGHQTRFENSRKTTRQYRDTRSGLNVGGKMSARGGFHSRFFKRNSGEGAANELRARKKLARLCSSFLRLPKVGLSAPLVQKFPPLIGATEWVDLQREIQPRYREVQQPWLLPRALRGAFCLVFNLETQTLILAIYNVPNRRWLVLLSLNPLLSFLLWIRR